MAAPTAQKQAARRRPGLRPHLSAIGLAISAPAKAPACMTDTMFALRLAWANLFLVGIWNSFWNEGSVRTPPIIPISIPNRVPPKQDYRISKVSRDMFKLTYGAG